jgi:hypothetical protein
MQGLLLEKDDVIILSKEQKSQAISTYKKASDEHIENLIKSSISKDKELYVSNFILNF